MLNFDDHRYYRDVLVSGVEHDFSRQRHEDIPHRLYADWAALIVRLARAVHPSFAAPDIPARLDFQTESISSDGPYAASADYYMLDYVYCLLPARDGGLKIWFENGRWGGDNAVSMETTGLSANIYSHIDKQAKSPRAAISIWHGAERAAEIADIIARHREYCWAGTRKWKTGRGTFLIEKNLRKIPYVDGGVGLDGGERFDDSAEYVEATPAGRIVKQYDAPRPFALQEEMTVSDIHRVIGDRLYRFYYSRSQWYEPHVTAELLLSGIEPLAAAPPFDPDQLSD